MRNIFYNSFDNRFKQVPLCFGPHQLPTKQTVEPSPGEDRQVYL